MSAILFGSIGTIADTSELQREAFNQAFTRHGLDWHWGQEEYRDLLKEGGGAQRVADHASSLGQDVDAAAVHRSKSEIFQRSLAEADLHPRPGVVETITGARTRGLKVALVTTTSPENVSALLQALGPDVGADAFDLVVDTSRVERPKPDEAAYAFALRELAEDPGACVAIEDNLTGVASARAAHLPCVAFPGTNNAGHDFAQAGRVVDHLDLDELTTLIGRTA